MLLNIQMLPVCLPENFGIISAEYFRQMTEKMTKISKGVGKNTHSFQNKKNELLQVAQNKQRLIQVLRAPSYIRPLFDLWRTDRDFLHLAPPRQGILSHIEKLCLKTKHQRLGRLALLECCQVFFYHYDELKKNLSELCAFLVLQMNKYQRQELFADLSLLYDQKDNIFTPDGHNFLVQKALAEHGTLQDTAQQCGVTTRGRFFELSQNIFYLERLKELPANVDDPLLSELKLSRVYNTRIDDTKKLGHAVLEILIDTLSRSGASPSELWRSVLLEFGGDPRVPQTNMVFREWWMPVGAERIQKMYEWLSEMDMELFLTIWEEFMMREGDGAMQRMFPERKAFLQGLFKKKGVVKGSRLFLGSQPEEYLHKMLPEKQRPYYSHIVDDPKLTIVYLNLGTAHLVEGSHNFAMTIMDKIPSNSPLANYNEPRVLRRQLGVGLGEEYEQEFGLYYQKILRKSHNGAWVTSAYDMLRKLNVPIQAQDVMDGQQYRRMYSS